MRRILALLTAMYFYNSEDVRSEIINKRLTNKQTRYRKNLPLCIHIELHLMHNSLFCFRNELKPIQIISVNNCNGTTFLINSKCKMSSFVRCKYGFGTIEH